MSVDIWPWARQKIKPADKAEVYAWAKANPRTSIVLGYNSRQRTFFANIGGHEATDPLAPMAAFHKAIHLRERVEVVSLLSGPAA